MSFDPIRSFSRVRHELGEHGGVNMSMEALKTDMEMDAGIRPGFVRISIGHPGTLEDRWAQFERALRVVGMC